MKILQDIATAVRLTGEVRKARKTGASGVHQVKPVYTVPAVRFGYWGFTMEGCLFYGPTFLEAGTPQHPGAGFVPRNDFHAYSVGYPVPPEGTRGGHSMIPFTFPATMEEFMAYQEQLINRPLSEVEREITAEWLPIINEAGPEDIQIAFRHIHRGNESGTGAVDLHAGRLFDAQFPGHHQFLTAAKVWMEVAAV